MIRKEGPHTNVGFWAPSYLARLLGGRKANANNIPKVHGGAHHGMH